MMMRWSWFWCELFIYLMQTVQQVDALGPVRLCAYRHLIHLLHGNDWNHRGM